MEKDLLLYLMYKAFIVMRSRSSASKKDNITFELCNIMHNVPLQLIARESDQEVYKKLLQHANGDFIEKWLQLVQEEFLDVHPGYKAAT